MKNGNATTADRLQQIMKERGLKQSDILDLAKPFCDAHKIKLSKSNLSQYVRGEVQPGQSKLSILGLALGVNEAWLMGVDCPPERKTSPKNMMTMPAMSRVKILSSIPCGDPSLAEEDVIGETMLPDAWGSDYALQCSGTSMEPEIHDGDLVAIHKTEEQPVNGTICAVAIDGEATLKKFYKYPDYIELRAINPEFQSIVIVGPKMASVQIYGVAVGMMRNFTR